MLLQGDLVSLVSPRTGGRLPRQCAHWLAMTVLLREIATGINALAMTLSEGVGFRFGDGTRVGAGEKLKEHSTVYLHHSPKV